MQDSTIKFLRDLIAIDSVNPSLVPGGAGEAAVAGRVADEMRAIGLDVDIMEVARGRPNVVGVMEGRRPGPSLMSGCRPTPHGYSTSTRHHWARFAQTPPQPGRESPAVAPPACA